MPWSKPPEAHDEKWRWERRSELMMLTTNITVHLVAGRSVSGALRNTDPVLGEEPSPTEILERVDAKAIVELATRLIAEVDRKIPRLVPRR